MPRRAVAAVARGGAIAIAVLVAAAAAPLGVVPAVTPALAAAEAPAVGNSAVIDMTVQGAHGPISLRESSTPSVHIGADIDVLEVTVVIDPELDIFYGYSGRFTAVDGPFGVFRDGCVSSSFDETDVFRCVFDVPVRAGLNRFEFEIAAYGIAHTVVNGAVDAVPFRVVSGLEVGLPGGDWLRLDEGGRAEIPGADTAALRYIVENHGEQPFRALGSCSDAPIQPGAMLICRLRGPRPGFALLGDYRVPLVLLDATDQPVPHTVAGRISFSPAPR